MLAHAITTKEWAMNRYTFTRTSLFEETFVVEANSEEEARELVQDGGPEVSCTFQEWIDWYDDEYSLERVDDELVEFVNSKEAA
jgi:hypothetical protein